MMELINDSFSKKSSLSNCEDLIDEADYCQNKISLSEIYDNCGNDTSNFDVNNTLESQSFIQDTMTCSSLKDNILLNSIIYGMMYCPNCKIPCSIIFNDNFNISFECDCLFIKNIPIKEFINDYIKKVNFKNKEYSMHCKFHFEQTKFIKYCINCRYDLCEKCLNDKFFLLSNKIISNKKHDNHSFINYEKITKKFENIVKLMEKYENGIYFINNEDKNIKEKIQKVFQLINCIIENFQLYKCYNLYKSLENAEVFLIKINDINFKIDNNEYPYIKLLKIKSDEGFNKNIIDFSQKIVSINIIECEGRIDLSSFKNIRFLNLKELTLLSDKCNDISPLFSCEFPVLEILNLGDNEINNTIIDLLKKLSLPELTYLNLYSNKITDLKLFEVINKFKKLKHFFAGENQFELDKNPEDFYEFPKSLEEFGMTGNLEGDKCNFIKRLDISNLIIFYISRNNIDNLSYIENIKFKRLEEFYSMRNNITDIKEIKKIKGKEKLKLIDLRGNQINNFNELIDIIPEFKNLKKLVIKNNKYINETQIIDMKKLIKEKAGLESLKL